MAQEIDRTVELSINGMTCGHCVASVTEELKEVPGVLDVEVILNSGATPNSTTTPCATLSPRPASNWSESPATSDP